MGFEVDDEFEAQRPAFEAKIAALPEPFRARVARFRRRPGWDAELGGYEVFTCEEAVKIAALGSVARIDAFCAMSLDEQRVAVPTLDYEEHSPNTFGVACRLAAVFLKDASLVPRAHGALCALTGCDAYGCWAASEEAAAERASGA